MLMEKGKKGTLKRKKKKRGVVSNTAKMFGIVCMCVAHAQPNLHIRTTYASKYTSTSVLLFYSFFYINFDFIRFVLSFFANVNYMKPKILQAGHNVYFTLIVTYNDFCVKNVWDNFKTRFRYKKWLCVIIRVRQYLPEFKKKSHINNLRHFISILLHGNTDALMEATKF